MDVVSVKFKEEILKKIDSSIIEHNFNSRTEFIREAVRDKLERLNTEELLSEFMKFRGKAKKKTTYEEDSILREKVGDKLFKELEEKFQIKS